MYTFRIDDVSLNTDMDHLRQMILEIEKVVDHHRLNLLLGITPAVFDMSGKEGLTAQRAFPRILNAYSDHRLFYQINKVGVPEGLGAFGADLAGHGLIHVDHRLLTREAQEMSILTSCSLVESTIFIPPFNKWNAVTKEICKEHNITLVKFEDGWRHLAYEAFNPNHPLYYFHTHDMTVDQLRKRLHP